jgi:hypothetical protein
MKIYFKKDYKFYTIDRVTDERLYSCYHLTTNEWLKVIKKIRSIFKSVETHDLIVRSGRGHTFTFKNEADEAYFLLWSNGGVEI